MEKELSIVIPVFNQWKYTAECVASVLKADIPKDYEIIVVDNASTDFTPKLLDTIQKEGHSLRVIHNNINLNYLSGANIGWKEADSKYCLHLNNDTTIYKDTIKTLLDVFFKDEKIGIAGSIQYFPNGYREPPLRYFYRGDADVGNLYRVDFPKEVDENLSKGIYTPPIEVDSPHFACGIVKREVWEKIGYFDDRFWPCMYEMEDYAMRAKEAGFKLVMVPNSKFIHHVAVSTRENTPYYQSIIDRNREIFRQKWGEKLRKKEI